MAPSVSIIIPAYNPDPTQLQQSVASALAQTAPSVEVIVVDDGSTERVSREALESLRGIHLIQQDNAGPAAARNRGIDAARSEIIIPLDADDWIDPQFAVEAVATLRNPETTVAYPGLLAFGELKFAWPTRGKLTLADFIHHNAAPISSAFRRADWEAAAGYDSSMLVGYEDWEFWVRLLSQTGGYASPLPSACMHYRVQPGSRSKERPMAEDEEATRQRIVNNAGAQPLARMLTALWEHTDQVEKQLYDLRNDKLYLRPVARRMKMKFQKLLPGRS